MFIAALLVIAKSGNNPYVPQQRNGYRQYDSFTQQNTIQLLKMTASRILQQMDGHRKYYPE